MVVDGHREYFLGLILSDDVLIQVVLYLSRLEKVAALGGLGLRGLLGDNFAAQLNAFIAYVNGGASDKFFYIVLALAAK